MYRHRFIFYSVIDANDARIISTVVCLHESRRLKLNFLPFRTIFILFKTSRPRSASRRLALMTSTILYSKLRKDRFTKYVYLQTSRPSKDETDIRLTGISFSLPMTCWGITVMSAPVSSLAWISNERLEKGFVNLTFKEGAGGEYLKLYFMA